MKKDTSPLTYFLHKVQPQEKQQQQQKQQKISIIARDKADKAEPGRSRSGSRSRNFSSGSSRSEGAFPRGVAEVGRDEALPAARQRKLDLELSGLLARVRVVIAGSFALDRPNVPTSSS